MGLARSLEPHGDGALTQSGVTLGTFDYISPEQALEPREADVRSDLYSLGCTFYHLLTGRPPVPEGTAAKKLHHHQHVAPVDPRQLNPAVSDEVAAILNRLMAKDVADRYQHPEALIQHLSRVAQQLGVPDEVPSGAPPLEAVLPEPPRLRPALVGVAAAAAVVLLVILHSMVSWPAAAPTGAAASGPAGSKPAELPAEPAPLARAGTPGPKEAAPAPPQSTPQPRAVGTARELSAYLAETVRERQPTAHVYLTRDIDLTAEERDAETGQVPGLVFSHDGAELIVEPSPELRTRPTIRLTYNPNLPREGPEGVPVWTAITVRAGRLVLRGLRFEVNATQAEIHMAAVRLQGSGQLALENCEFLQVNPPDANQGQLSSLAIESLNSRAVAQPVEVRHCYFGFREPDPAAGTGTPGGQDAVTVTGPATVRLTDCALGPHSALVHLRGGAGGGRGDVRLQHCSALLLDGAAFQVSDGAACRLDVRDSIFSRPSTPSLSGAAATLVQQTGEGGDVRFHGYGNRYHNLSAFWLKSSSAMEVPTGAPTWEKFQQFLKQGGESDERSHALAASPWAEDDPMKWLRKDPPEPRRAFQVDVRLAGVREADHPATRVAGISPATWGSSLWQELLPSLRDGPPRLAAGTKVVDPEVSQSGNGFYPSLNQAILDARPGDVILVKPSGAEPVPVDPIRLEKTKDLTVRPFGDTHPVLTLGETPDAGAALFHLYDGTLRLERLQFLLRPRHEKFTAQAVVDVVGQGCCVFEDCVITLDQPGSVRLGVAMLNEPSGVMKMGPAAPDGQVPRVFLKRCFVRGEGDLLSVHAGRSLQLKVEDSLIVLNGSLLNSDGAVEPPVAPLARLELTQVTAYLTDHLVRLAGRDIRSLLPVEVRPVKDCLFASGGGKALVHLDGLETSDAQMHSVLTWEGTHNAYSRFAPMLDQKPRGEDMPLPPYDRDRWKTFTGETDAMFVPVKFADPPGPGTALAAVGPARFRVGSEYQQYGAAVNELPTPVAATDEAGGK
jgi:hypothetical protein